MDVLDAFVLQGTSYSVNIHWANDEPIFRASDLGKVLGIKNVHMSTLSYDAEEKVFRSVLGGNGAQQMALFLTEQATYKLIMHSRKPIAAPLQKWVFDVIKTIRKTGRYSPAKPFWKRRFSV